MRLHLQFETLSGKERVNRRVTPDEILVSENPDQTGSFFIGYELSRYVLSPAGEIALDALELVD